MRLKRETIATLCLLLAFLTLGAGELCAQPSAEADPESPAADDGPEDAPPTDPLVQIAPGDTGRDLIERAQNLYEYGDYPTMVILLQAGLERDKFSGAQLDAAHRLLGIGYFILQKRERARDFFIQLLMRDPDAKLDPLYVPPVIIEFFDSIREENREMLEAIRDKQRRKQESPATRVVTRRNPYFVNFIPFGAGQFQNDEPVKGALFLSGELLMLSLNVTSYFVSDSLAGPDGYYTSGNAKAARDWRIVQYSALGALGALVIWGVIDAALNWEEYTELRVEPIGENDEGESPAAQTGFRF